jgi:hypothetical protein
VVDWSLKVFHGHELSTHRDQLITHI